MEWNGKFRDEVRGFMKGNDNYAYKVAMKLMGSPDLYQKGYPWHSINFITCHDGYVLNDLVSYDKKYNLANGEDGRDGHNDNCSWNCGYEGETSHPLIFNLRRRQMKNFIAILMISQGIPMILCGTHKWRWYDLYRQIF